MKHLKGIDKDELLFMYQKINEQKNSNIENEEFCKIHKINANKFKNFKYRIEFNKSKDIDFIKKFNPIIKEYEETNISMNKICIKYSLKRSQFQTYLMHLNYLKVLNEHYKNNEGTMDFIKLNNKPLQIPDSSTKELESIPKVEPEPEIVDKQNDIEILISKGIKVSISSNIESVKIIKIIDLLKDI